MAKQKKKNNKKKVLLGIFIPVTAIAVAAAISVPIVVTNNKTTDDKPETVKVTFNYNYEDCPVSSIVFVKRATPVAKPTNPIRGGYDFVNWYTDKECTKLYNFNLPVSWPITLYAGWESAERHTITFNTRTEETIDPVEVKHGKLLTRPADPYKQFCKVKYWYRDDKTVPYDFNSPVTESFTLNAYYTAVETTVKVNGLNFNGVAEASNFSDFADMYLATKQVVQNTLGGFTLQELCSDATVFKNGFTDIKETDTAIYATITYELYTKEGETLNILSSKDIAAESVSDRFIYSARRQNNYCGTDTASGKPMYIDTIALRSGCDDKARLHYGERYINPKQNVNVLQTMYYKTDSLYHCSSYIFDNLDIDNFELTHQSGEVSDVYSCDILQSEASRRGQILVIKDCNLNQTLPLGTFKSTTIDNCHFYQDSSKETAKHFCIKDSSAIYLATGDYVDTTDHEISITNCVFDNFPRGIHIEDLSASKITIKNNVIKNINQYASSKYENICKNNALHVCKTKTNGEVYIENNTFENCNCNCFKVDEDISTKSCQTIFNVNNNTITNCKYVGWSEAPKTSYTWNISGNVVDELTCQDKTEIDNVGTTTSEEEKIVFLIEKRLGLS